MGAEGALSVNEFGVLRKEMLEKLKGGVISGVICIRLLLSRPEWLGGRSWRSREGSR